MDGEDCILSTSLNKVPSLGMQRDLLYIQRGDP